MIKKRFLWLLLFAALVMSGSALFAQAPAGPEKAMIYNGESLKIQLTGDIRLNMVQNKWNVVNDVYGLWVANQKFGSIIFSWAPALTGIPNVLGNTSAWTKWPGALTRGSLIFDVRYSQIGLTIAGPGILGGTSFGRFEMDFYGGYGNSGGNVSRQPVLRLRNAFAGLAWQKDMFGFKVTFGQFTSLVTPVLAYPVGLSPLPFFSKGVLFDWDQGIMLSFTFGTPKVNLMVDVAMARVKAGNDATANLYQGEGFNMSTYDRGAGEASMQPMWNGRIAFNLNPDPIFGLTLAINGHYGNEHQQNAHANYAMYGFTWPAYYIQAQDVPTKSAGLQAKVSVWIFTLQGSGWMGENMDNFVSQFGVGFRESVSGRKNLAEKGKGGYAGLYIVGPKVGIPIVLFFQMGQELKNHNQRIPYANAIGAFPAAGSITIALYQGVQSASVVANSEIGGGLWIYLNQYLKVGYEVGQQVTEFKGVNGSSANIFHRATASFTF